MNYCVYSCILKCSLEIIKFCPFFHCYLVAVVIYKFCLLPFTKQLVNHDYR